ncbi:MAG: flavodoxin family protein, partial [bacterium]|nr:flavodoxin family protein [bacterium]
MKGLIYYFSTTGNTKLACEYIVKKVNGIEFTLSDITKKENLDLNDFDLVGFATWADYLGPSQLFHDFISAVPNQENKPTFIFCTAGGLPGRTLLIMKKLVSEKGFLVLTGFQLMTPDNYPPIIISGRLHPDYPNEK